MAQNKTIAALLVIVWFLKSCNFTVNANIDVNRLFEQWSANGTKTILAPSHSANSNDPPADKNSSPERKPAVDTTID